MGFKFDNEYGTENLDEVKEFERCGIRYTFVKKVDGRTVWKYKKTPRLFEVLKNYYINNVYMN